MEEMKMTVNGRILFFKTGQTILEAAREAGIDIPTLCHLKGTTPTGACRICVVELEGAKSLVASCATPAEAGMVIQTESPQVVKARRSVIGLMLASGDHSDCMLCPVSGNCELQALAFRYKVKSPFREKAATCKTEAVNPLIIRNFSKCILCGRCVQACKEVQVNNAIGFGYRGSETKIVTGGDLPLVESDCVFCGECLQACPTGALVIKDALEKPRLCDTEAVRTTCPYCGVGCQQTLHVYDGKIVQVTGSEGAEPNQGRLCVKGRFGYGFIYSEDRLKTPLIKKGDKFVEASWDEALDLVADKFKQIIAEDGPDALAGISCARSINEDSYQMQKFFRAVLGTNNIDHCARTCHAPTVAGLAASFGSGAMTNSFREFENAELFFVIGSNMTEAHPVASTFLKNAVRKGAKLIVADPRKHKLAGMADIYLPLAVGTDVALINGLMHVIIKEGLHDKEFIDKHTVDFEALKETVRRYTPEKTSEICRIPAETITDAARFLASVRPSMLCYTLGITEHTCGTDNVKSTANLQMLLGNMGVECGGVNPLRGQNNVQGACDMGALPNVFPGYHNVTDPASRKKFEAAWAVENLPDKNGLMIPQMMDGLATKKIRALYIFGENLANTEPDIRKTEHELASAEFLVVQDIFPNETTKFADVILPAAAWSENDGTFTNSERRVSRVRGVSRPPGIAQPNWWIFRELAKRFGQVWESENAWEIWNNEISVLAPQMTGIKYYRIENDGLQWPCPDTRHPGTKYLHGNGNFTHGKGIFHALEWAPPAEVADEEYPMVLSTGRRLYHYHTRTQTGRCDGLNELLGEETADISPGDAAVMEIKDGEYITVSSRRGSVQVRARVTDEIPEGMVWMAFHFREGNANWLTNPAFDPVTMTAEFKACSVRIEKLKN